MLSSKKFKKWSLIKISTKKDKFWRLIGEQTMKYIVNSKEVSRDTFYFCQNVKVENKSFVLLANNIDIGNYINKHPDYDYYIRDDIATYYTKGDAFVKEWYERGWSSCTCEDIAKRYAKSKFKDTMSLEDWYTKNGWAFKSVTKYPIESFDIPTVENFEEKLVKTKLFSVTVTNDDTVKAINEIREKYGDFCIEYVLRNYTSTEIIYRDNYKEI